MSCEACAAVQGACDALLWFYRCAQATRQLPAGFTVLKAAWNGCRWWLFDGAAVSAFFVVIIVALTVLLALRYMLLTRRSLSHPRSAFGRGLMIATGLFAALHFVNIGTHVSMLARVTTACLTQNTAGVLAQHLPWLLIRR